MRYSESGQLKTRCPECLARIWLKSNARLWDPVTCPECHTSLEVIALHPPTLGYMPAEPDAEGWPEDNLAPGPADSV